MPTLKRTNPSVRISSSTSERSLLPTSSGRRQVIPTGTSFLPKEDPSVASAPFEAQAKVGRAITDLGVQAGQIFNQINTRLNEAEDKNSLLRFNNELTAKLNVYNEYISQNPHIDLDQQKEFRDGLYTSTQKNYVNKDTRTGLRGAISGQIMKIGATQDLEARKLNIALRKDKVLAENAFETNKQIKNSGTMNKEQSDQFKAETSQRFRDLARLGFITSQDAAKSILEMRKKVDTNRLYHDVQQSDRLGRKNALELETAVSGLEYPDINPHAPAVIALINRAYKKDEAREKLATKKMKQRHKDNAAKITLEIFQRVGSIEPVDHEELNAALENNDISVKDYLELKVKLDDGVAELGDGDAGFYAETLKRVESLDFTVNKSFLLDNMKNGNLNYQMYNKLQDLIQKVHPLNSGYYKHAVSALKAEIQSTPPSFIMAGARYTDDDKAYAAGLRELRVVAMSPEGKMMGNKLIAYAKAIGDRKNKILARQKKQSGPKNPGEIEIFRQTDNKLTVMFKNGLISEAEFIRQYNKLIEVHPTEFRDD